VCSVAIIGIGCCYSSQPENIGSILQRVFERTGSGTHHSTDVLVRFRERMLRTARTGYVVNHNIPTAVGNSRASARGGCQRWSAGVYRLNRTLSASAVTPFGDVYRRLERVDSVSSAGCP
jgi:hypothetical protein